MTQRKEIGYLEWRRNLNKITPSDMRIGEDVLLIEGKTHKDMYDRPFKTDVTTCLIYMQGWVHFTVNMREFKAEAPCMIIMPSDTIIQTLKTSEDCKSNIIVMSRAFSDSLFSVQHNLYPLYQQIINNPVMPLGKDLEAVTSYYELLKRMVIHNLPNSLEAARHLTLALFYAYTGLKHQKHIASEKRERKNEIYDQFIDLVRAHYKTEREIGFYAEKMYITPKYLSRTIKDASGRTAMEWIEEYVIIESKALLYSTNLTIQQIATEMHFESQSLFGKYFKRVTGLSPRGYRSSLTKQ
jgi:AraC-like DNA-binding protein